MLKSIKSYFILVLASLMLFSCKKDSPQPESNTTPVVIPNRFSLNMPHPDIFGDPNFESEINPKKMNGEVLRSFMAEVVEETNKASHMMVFNLRKLTPIQFTAGNYVFLYLGSDGKEKKAVLSRNVKLDGTTWPYSMKIYENKNLLAMQMVWNNAEKKSTVIINPYYLNTNFDQQYLNTRYKIDYTEKKNNQYDRTMTVSMYNLPELNILPTIYINNVKFTAGQKGDVVELFGNANMPKLKLHKTDTEGHSYFFTMRCNNQKRIGVASTGLAPSNTTSADQLFKKFAMKTVIAESLKKDNIELNDTDTKLEELVTPGYFYRKKFQGAGKPIPSQPGFSPSFVELDKIQVFKPEDIAKLKFDF